MSEKKKQTEANGFKVSQGETRYKKRLSMKAVTSNSIDIKISSKDTEGKLAVLEVYGAPGGPPLHIHPFQDEVVYVLDGEFLWKVGTEKYYLKERDTIFLPKAVPHGFKQLTESGTLLLTYYPAGKIEEYFKITDAWTDTPSQEEIIHAFEQGEMKVVGPPIEE